MNDIQLLSAIALDLKRVAMGSFNNSNRMSEIFLEKAITTAKKISNKNTPEHIQGIISRIPDMLNHRSAIQNAETALMYSTLIQNYATKNHDS